jgi:phosphatidylglycerol:prolipoprotein diacylglycerol transferase
MMGRFSYGLFMLLALAVFLVVRHFVPKPAGLLALPWWKRAGLGMAAFIGGALGAKLPFALTSPDGWWTMAGWFQDGKTIVAGLLGAYLAVEAAKLLLDVRVKTGDTFALPLALAMVVGRLGCFCNGCCYGRPTDLPWGVPFQQPDKSWLVCHPTQIYECFFHFIMALVLFELLRRRLLPGQHLKLYFICYGVYRFLTEFIRPEPPYALGLTFYQWAALLLTGSMVVLWAIDWLAPRRAAVLAPSHPGPASV